MKQTARPALSRWLALVLLAMVTSSLPAQILDLNPQPRLDREGTLPSNPEFLADLYGIALFRAYEPLAGAELWRTDGTRAGTYLLADMTPGPASSTVWNVAVAGAQAFVAAGSSLWLTDGTTTGTYLVRNFGTWNIAYLTTLGDVALFDVYDGPHGQELWRSDGTAAGTYLLKDTLPGSNCGDPRPLARVGDLLFFSASAGGHRDLWRTDGTVAGTFLLKTFQYVYHGAACNNEGYFSVAGMAHDLWKSDGTIAGTVPVKNTASGTRFPTNLVALGRTLIFEGDKKLWASDGTTAGTQVISSQVAPYFWGRTTFVSSGDAVYFDGSTTAHGQELWRTDGTIAGTRMVCDVNPGPSNGIGHYATCAGEPRVFFTATDGVSGEEVWFTDGTSAGTRLWIDIQPGPCSSNPRSLFLSGGLLYCGADTGWTGHEPWAIPVGATAFPVGQGSAAGLRSPTLRATAPTLGSSIRFAGDHGPPGVAGLLLVSSVTRSPLRLGPGCHVYVHLALAAQVASLPDQGGPWERWIAVPASPSLIGLHLAAQAFFAPARTVPWGIETTNGVHLRLDQ